MCPVCRGRGEVEAGITGGVVEYGSTTMAYDWRGNLHPARPCFPTVVRPNPKAFIRNARTGKNEIWFLETNSYCELWGIAVCGSCRGSGFR